MAGAADLAQGVDDAALAAEAGGDDAAEFGEAGAVGGDPVARLDLLLLAGLEAGGRDLSGLMAQQVELLLARSLAGFELGEFGGGVTDPLNATFSFDAWNETTGTALATASYVAGQQQFTGADLTVTIGGTASTGSGKVSVSGGSWRGCAAFKWVKVRPL